MSLGRLVLQCPVHTQLPSNASLLNIQHCKQLTVSCGQCHSYATKPTCSPLLLTKTVREESRGLLTQRLCFVLLGRNHYILRDSSHLMSRSRSPVDKDKDVKEEDDER